MCHEYGISRQNYSNRRHRGWSIEEALTTPIEKNVTDHLGNSYATVSEMCQKYRINRQTYFYRRRKGWSIEKALTIPTSR